MQVRFLMPRKLHRENIMKQMEIHVAPRLSTNYEVITLSDEDTDRDAGCFACSDCNECLAGRAVVSLESKKYCWKCFEKAFGQKCLFCQKLITGVSQMNFVYYNNQVWHKECFKLCRCS